ncbi:uncharacterized protein L203_104445 [Cryptococcus depauperatus CBS 7841]|uniref:SGNH hydrolase-type esterase domain-containing protein n=1 Tax=Cryptococcus depauperatus CBS 7841 TaxID=1295531 RepID=A0AAJ8JVJ0_9TREE
MLSLSEEEKEEGHELVFYGRSSSTDATRSSRPLLSQDHSPPLSSSHWHGRYRAATPLAYSVGRSGRVRMWRIVAFMALPPLLLFLYSLIHPHVNGLPPLPKISITSGEVISEPFYEEDIIQDCICGETDEGRRLCSLYHKEGLRNSRLIQGTGARGFWAVASRHVMVSTQVQTFPKVTREVQDVIRPSLWIGSGKHFQRNGAIGGMDSSYYAFCGAHHIAANTDLVILEFDVNDQTDPLYQTFFDQLLRALSEFESEPAILILGAWGPLVAQDQGYGDPQIVHAPIALYYDVPYLSLKRLVFNHYLRYPQSMAKAFFQPDMLHANARGHRLLSDLLIAYMESELCMLSRYGLPTIPPIEDTVSSTNPFSDLIDVLFPLDSLHLVSPSIAPDNWEETFKLEPLQALAKEKRLFIIPSNPYVIPHVGIFTPLRDVIDPKQPDPDSGKHITGIAQPELFCADANDKLNPMAPTKAEGWEPFVWNGEKHYWNSSIPGSRITVNIKVNAGQVAVYYFRSQHYDLGDARCWVDDNEKGAVKLAGYWTKQYNTAVVAYIDDKVASGNHYVTCEVANTTSHPTKPDAHHFRLTAVMAT